MEAQAQEEQTQSPQERRRNAVREQILQHAAEIVLESGVDALSMRVVAQRADYTVGALYRYFASADELFAGVALQVLERLGGKLQSAYDAGPTALGALCAMIDTYRRFAVQDPHGFALVTQLLSVRRFLVADAEHATEIALAVGQALGPVCLAFEQAEAAGELATTGVAESSMERAFALFGALQGALLLDKLARRAPGLLHADATAHMVASSMLRGWGAHPNTLSLQNPGMCTR